MSERPIVEVRAVNYSWPIDDPRNPGQPLTAQSYRLEIRREGETEWTRIAVVEVEGPPEDGK